MKSKALGALHLATMGGLCFCFLTLTLGEPPLWVAFKKLFCCADIF
jgi:hypothetical protein